MRRVWQSDRGKAQPEDVPSSVASNGTLPNNGNPLTDIKPARASTNKPARPWAIKIKTLIVVSCLLAILVLGILFSKQYINNHLQGIVPVSQSSYMHYAWTVPPALVATILGLLLGAISFKMQRMMPWFAMAEVKTEGAVGADSVFLDYLDQFSVLVPYYAYRKRHWIILASAIAGLLSRTLSVLLNPLIYLRPAMNDSTVTMWKAADIGLADSYKDLWGFYKAVMGMSTDMANAAGDLPAASPWMSNDGWVVGPFQVGPGDPTTALLKSSNMTAILPVIRTYHGCEPTYVALSFKGVNGTQATWGATGIGKESRCHHTRDI